MNWFLRTALAHIGLAQQRKAKRTSAPELEVLCEPGPEINPVVIRDISNTGLFLLSPRQIQPGAKTVLTLRRKYEPDSGSSPRGVRLHARVVRNDESGFGLTLVPSSSDAGSWLTLMTLARNLLADPEDRLGSFRLAAAFSFLDQISVTLRDELAQLMAGMNPEHGTA